MGQGVTLIDWDGMGDTITRVHNATSDSTSGVQGKDGLDGNVELGNVEVLEHDLDHSLSVFLGISWGFSQENTLVVWGDAKLLIITMMPNFLHIVPVVDDTVFNWVVEFEDTSFFLGFLTDIDVSLLSGVDNGLVFWVPNDGWEGTLRGFLRLESGFTHTGSVIDDN